MMPWGHHHGIFALIRDFRNPIYCFLLMMAEQELSPNQKSSFTGNWIFIFDLLPTQLSKGNKYVVLLLLVNTSKLWYFIKPPRANYDFADLYIPGWWVWVRNLIFNSCLVNTKVNFQFNKNLYKVTIRRKHSFPSIWLQIFWHWELTLEMVLFSGHCN